MHNAYSRISGTIYMYTFRDINSIIKHLFTYSLHSYSLRTYTLHSYILHCTKNEVFHLGFPQ